MNCKKCGNQINVDSKFCNMCGEPVENNLEESNKVEANSDTTNVVNTIPTTEEVRPSQTSEVVGNQNNEQTSMEPKEVVSTPEQNVNSQESVIETSQTSGAANVETSIAQNQAPVVESQNIANNNVSTMQNPIANNQMMTQNSQSVVSNPVSNNPMLNNMNNPVQSKKKVPVGLIVGIGVGVVIIGLVFILILTGGIKFNATIKSGGTTKQIIGNKSTTTSKITTSSKPSNNNSNNSIDAFDAILKLYTGDKPTEKNYEQVVSIIGEGVKDEGYSLPRYIWKQDENTSLSIIFHTFGNQDIQGVEIDYNRDDLKDANVNFSGAQIISSNINKQIPVYYNDIKTSFGVEGHLIGFSSYDYKYVWVSESGGYVEARFKKDTNQCLSFFGRI